MSAGILAEEEVLIGLRLGLAALKATPALLDRMFTNLAAGELARVRAYWDDHQMEIIRGYPVEKVHTFPIVSLVLGEERPDTELLGYGISTQDDVECHGELSRSTVVLYIYAEAAEACAWYYRIVRTLANVVRDRLLKVGFQIVTLTGAELIPSPEMGPGQMFVRRISISYTYLDVWDAEGALYTAIVGDSLDRVPQGADVGLRHEDVGGGVTPYEEE